MFRLKLLLVSLLLIGTPLFAEDSLWVGKIILPKRVGMKYAYEAKDGTWKQDGELVGISFRVDKQQGQWICVNQNGTEAWFAKEDAVLLDDATDYFSEVIRANPKSPGGYARRGWAWKLLGKLDLAKDDYDSALRLNPKFAAGWNNRGTILHGLGEIDKAIQDYSEAIRLEPRFGVAYKNRGDAYSHQKVYDKAIEDYATSIEIDKNDHRSLNALAWIYSTCPEEKYRNGKRAILHSMKACEITKEKIPSYFGTLAAAYAEAGDFTAAFRAMERAMSDEDYMKRFGELGMKMLKQFQDDKPFRDE
jgi:tetratricopeptide (TPR) repeat protein